MRIDTHGVFAHRAILRILRQAMTHSFGDKGALTRFFVKRSEFCPVFQLRAAHLKAVFCPRAST